MMEFSGMLPNTDNLFKFLFIGGLLMIITAMIYPMQKRQILDLEIISYNKEVELINNNVESISIQVRKLKTLDSTIENDLNKLKKLRDLSKNKNKKAEYATQFKNLKTQYLSSYHVVEEKLGELKIKNIVLTFNKNKISMLQEHAHEYGRYTFWFLLCGIPLTVIGIGGWGYATYITIVKTED